MVSTSEKIPILAELRFGHRQLQDAKLVLDDRAIKKPSAG